MACYINVYPMDAQHIKAVVHHAIASALCGKFIHTMGFLPYFWEERAAGDFQCLIYSCGVFLIGSILTQRVQRPFVPRFIPARICAPRQKQLREPVVRVCVNLLKQRPAFDCRQANDPAAGWAVDDRERCLPDLFRILLERPFVNDN